MKTARLLAVSCVSFGLAAAAQFSFDRVYDALAATEGLREVAVAPDGTRAAWAGAAGGIFIQDLHAGSGAPRRVAAGTGIAWSPDGRRLAFLSDQLYVTDANGGAPKRLTDLTGFLASPRWSPDGKSIAFLFTENAPRAAGPLQPSTPETGVIGAKIYHQRIAIVDANGGKVRQVSPPDLYIYEFDWAPDGRAFAATGAPGPGDDNWYIAKLYTIDIHARKTTALWKPPLQIADPRWSPDGRAIAFVSGLMSDEGMTGGDVFLIPASGGEARNLTPGMRASAAGIHWLEDGRILIPQLAGGETAFAALDPQSGRRETLWRGPGVVSQNGWLPGAALSRDGKTSAVIRHSFTDPPEIWAGPIGAWKQITNLNADRKPEWGEARSLRWTSEGRRVQGWLLYPRAYDANKRWPLVVWVHGGPAGMEGSHWPAASTPSLLAAAGYFVLFPNPRGSLGFGEDFAQANIRDFGYGDFRDILNGVDEVIRTLPVDNNRVGITGWSYGGYMTMWAVTQTNRFRAAVAGAGLSNWQSYYGENLIDQWMLPYFGASVYDDPAAYARSSPITYIKNVKTPTLIVVGERDAECPAPQSWEFWHALKTLGVKTEFVIYPGEGHAIANPAHQRDIIRRTLAWFDGLLASSF
ncbi:MAG: prolyl oligopeptidase family serine peptidase [Acidobacteriota bacterium]